MQPIRAISLKLASLVIFVAMASLIKAATHEVPPGQAVFFRAAFAIPVIVIWLYLSGDFPARLKTTRPLAHLWRGLIGTSAMGFGFAGLFYLPLPEVTAIGYLAPVLVVVLAAIFLGERLRFFRMSAVALGLIGVMIVVWPRLTLLQGGGEASAGLGAIFVLFSAVCAAIAQITVRGMVKTEGTAAIVFYFSVSAAVYALVTLPFGWVIPSSQVAIMLVIAGLLGGIGQIFLTSSYRFADVSVIAPFEYASILLAILSGYFFFDEVPTGRTLLGAGLVTIAGIIIIWRERQLGLKRGTARQLLPPGGK